MQNFFILSALILGILSFNAHADQATLKAIKAAGIELSKEQTQSFPKQACKGECPELVEAIASLVADFENNDAAVEAILRAASKTHPKLTQAFSDAAILVAPNQVALIASLTIELAPTAAGIPTATPPGLGIAQSQASPFSNIPTSVGGGASSSPN